VSPDGDIKEDFEVLKLLLFLEQISQRLNVHRGTFQGMEVTTLHLKITLHLPNQLVMIPEGNKRELYSDPRRHLSAYAREPEKVTSNIQNRYFMITQRWFSKTFQH
jgi:hypothetical protein